MGWGEEWTSLPPQEVVPLGGCLGRSLTRLETGGGRKTGRSIRPPSALGTRFTGVNVSLSR